MSFAYPAALALLVAPVLLIGWVWLGEQPRWLTLVGGAITVGGVALANARRVMPAPIAPAVVEQVCEP